MNALAPQRHATILANLPETPRLSRPVAIALDHAIAPAHGAGLLAEVDDQGRVVYRDPGHRLPPPLLSAPAWEEAQRAAAMLDEMLAPVTAEHVTAWLLPLNLAGGSPLSPTDFRLRATAIAELVADLPAQAFTAETRRRVASKGFFPSAHEVRAAVEPVASDWRRKRDALRGLHRAVASKATKPAPIETPEEKAAYAEINQRTVQALKDEADERENLARPGGGKPTPSHIGARQRIEYFLSKGQMGPARAIAKANHIDLDEVLDRAR